MFDTSWSTQTQQSGARSWLRAIRGTIRITVLRQIYLPAQTNHSRNFSPFRVQHRCEWQRFHHTIHFSQLPSNFRIFYCWENIARSSWFAKYLSWIYWWRLYLMWDCVVHHLISSVKENWKFCLRSKYSHDVHCILASLPTIRRKAWLMPHADNSLHVRCWRVALNHIAIRNEPAGYMEINHNFRAVFQI